MNIYWDPSFDSRFRTGDLVREKNTLFSRKYTNYGKGERGETSIYNPFPPFAFKLLVLLPDLPF